MLNNRATTKIPQDSRVKEGVGKKAFKNNDSQNEDFDFWNTPQNDNYAKKKR